MVFERIRETPHMVSKDYATEYKEPIIANDENSGLWMEFFGTGVSSNKHPLKNKIRFRDCGNCNSVNVLLIYTKWSVHPMSGDVYWDYEVVCNDCGMFTARSFAEN